MKQTARMVGLWFSILLLIPGVLGAQELVGDWQGTLVFGKVQLRVILKVSGNAGKKLTAEFYSIDQTTDPIPVDSIAQEGKIVKFALPVINGSFAGTMSADTNTIEGTWTQGGPTPLKLERASKGTAWAIDPSKHTVQFVTVEPGVKLEVLDWGGAGRPMVLLTGLGNNAHVFDGFAEKLTSRYHVYGITRRGFGVSDTPPVSGDAYSADRLADDVVAVIDKLKLEKPVLVGHSIAGEELSSIGTRFPTRVAGLVYLDAGYPYALYDATRGDFGLDGITLRKKMAELSDAQSPTAMRAVIAEMLKTDLPQYEKDLVAREKELEGMPDAPNQPAPDKKDRHRISAEAVIAGEQKYTDIKSPVLAIFADPHEMSGPPLDEKQKAAAAAHDAVFTEGQAKAWERMVPSAKVIRIPNANHYVFKSNEAEVLKDVEEWVDALK
ncbi:MAG: alpha/beta hydrolase [Acidobacteria bacterium]|nr:alpha/beta hydrolase [Acidobacteriota bacterium]